jgi:hypothetical protein
MLNANKGIDNLQISNNIVISNLHIETKALKFGIYEECPLGYKCTLKIE